MDDVRTNDSNSLTVVYADFRTWRSGKVGTLPCPPRRAVRIPDMIGVDGWAFGDGVVFEMRGDRWRIHEPSPGFLRSHGLAVRTEGTGTLDDALDAVARVNAVVGHAEASGMMSGVAAEVVRGMWRDEADRIATAAFLKLIRGEPMPDTGRPEPQLLACEGMLGPSVSLATSACKMAFAREGEGTRAAAAFMAAEMHMSGFDRTSIGFYAALAFPTPGFDLDRALAEGAASVSGKVSEVGFRLDDCR